MKKESLKEQNTFLRNHCLETVQTDSFLMTCLKSLTGLTFILISENDYKEQSQANLKEIYLLYSEFVSKDPFYAVISILK